MQKASLGVGNPHSNVYITFFLLNLSVLGHRSSNGLYYCFT